MSWADSRPVYTVYLLYTGKRSGSLSARAAELHACVEESIGSTVTVALFAQGLISSVWMCLAGPSPSSYSLREEIGNGERHRGLIDPASLGEEDAENR